jgi:beta-lactamase regulating signal transducer with metallopeptidase domain
MTWQQAFVVAWIEFAVATALLLGGTLGAIKFFRQPAERARLVLLALAAALAVPVLSALAPWPAWNLYWVAPASTSPAVQEPIAAVWSNWSVAAVTILALHGAAALFIVVQWFVGRRRLARLCRAAVPPSQHVMDLWNALVPTAGRQARLLVSEEIHAPLAFGWWRPTVVVPRPLALGDDASLRYCLAHEWSHVERGDVRTWCLVRACQYFFWYQPAYWSLARELRICQEFLADHRSARAGDDAIQYSELLMSLAKNQFSRPVPGALNLLDQPSQLGRRIRMLLEETALAAHCRWRMLCGSLALLILLASGFSAIRIQAALAEETPPAKPKSYPSVASDKAEEQKNSEPGAPLAPLNYNGLVVEKGTDKPIAAAAVVVRRSDSSKRGEDRIIEESKHTTDADGKFSFTIPTEQLAVSRLYIELDVEHPDYAAKKGFGYGMSLIRKNESLGARPFFEKTELSPSDPVTGAVLAPNGQPLAGVKIQGFSRADLSNFNDHSFVDAVTTADGKFRLPLVKGGEAVIWVIPKDFAIVQRYLGKERGDLGEFTLEPGIRLSGRILNAEGKPVENVAVNINRERAQDDDKFNQLAVFTSVRRSALSDSEGRFTYDPLPAGEYQFRIEDHLSDPIEINRTRYPLPAVFVPRKVTLQADMAPVEIQAVPHVNFEAQYYNSSGEKTNGHSLTVYGKLDEQHWFGQGHAVDGHVELQVPHGIQDFQVNLSTNEHSSLRYRLKKGDPLKSERDNIKLGTLTDDVEGFEIIRYVAPVVLVKGVDEEGQPLKAYKVAAAYPWGEQRYIFEGEVRSDLSFEKQEDGRYRSEQMLPDEEVTFTAMAEGYENASEKLKVPEGEKQELTLTLKKKPAEPAPPEKTPGTEPAKNPPQE